MQVKSLMLIGILVGFKVFIFSPSYSLEPFLYSQTIETPFRSKAALQENMTLPADNIVVSSPVLVDLDKDGDNEIIIGDYDGEIHGWTYPGESVPGWESGLFCGGPIFSSPAVADIDNDGQFEIAVGSWFNATYVWQDNGEMQPGWPQNVTGYSIQSSAVLADLDLDGDLEVIIGGYDARLWVWHHDGTLMEGWPYVIGSSNLQGTMSTPAVANLDLSDDTPEIVVGSNDKNLYAWHANGTLVDGFPITTNGRIQASAALGDIDGDEYLEIVVGTENASLYAWNHDGSSLAGFPYKANNNLFASPALADLNKDGILNIIFVDMGGRTNQEGPNIHVLDYQGHHLPGWPQPIDIRTDQYNFVTVQSSPVVGDINGDSALEIVLGIAIANQKGGIIAFHHTGQLVKGFPINTTEAIQSTPILGDFAGDGDIEIIVGSHDGFVYVIDLSGVYIPENCPWSQFHHDEQNLGYQPISSVISPNSRIGELFASLLPIGLIGGGLLVASVYLYFKRQRKRSLNIN
ncbi:MAG: FG-GAP repeat domain-containing protein [Candidatus Hermodarchaeota archaeon]